MWKPQVWPTEGLMKFETLSYLPPLNDEQLCKEVDYLLRMKWIPCLEFTKLVIFMNFSVKLLN